MVLLAFLGTLPIIATPTRSSAATLPPGFSDSLIAQVLLPTALAFTPDDRMLVTSQPGELRVFVNGETPFQPALDLSQKLCANGERGLLGIAVSPDFSATGHIFLYYTANIHDECPRNTRQTPVNRVSRFTLSDDNTVSPSSEFIVADNIPSPSGVHNAGHLEFGSDGNLYVSVGDGSCSIVDPTRCAEDNENSRRMDIPMGKILRLTPEGFIPPDNPFASSPDARHCTNSMGIPPGSGPCAETYVSGLRNPFRFAFDPVSQEMLINDVGQSAWEEIDLAVPGADYGWNLREGPCETGSTTLCEPSEFTDPIYSYSHESGCSAITGGAFVPEGSWPAPYEGGYLFADYVCGQMSLLTDPTGAPEAQPFVSGLGTDSAVAMTFGPDGSGRSLYYTTYANGGEIHRLRYVGGTNSLPTAVMKASPKSGPVPLRVSFDASQSTDPDVNDELRYRWVFGDGARKTTESPTTKHNFESRGVYTASLVVEDEHGGRSDSATVEISVGNRAPQVRILHPTKTTTFSVGETIDLVGRAEDPEDGRLRASRLTWTVKIFHGNHTHPYLGPVTGNNIELEGPAPENVFAVADSHVQIALTARDSKGVETTVKRKFLPRRVQVAFDTEPAGLRVQVFELRFKTPRFFPSWAGWTLPISAFDQVDENGEVYTFSRWSDGGEKSHNIITPPVPELYTATYRAVQP